MYYIYILQCVDGSLYTGITADIKKRLTSHYYQKKEAAKYTKSHPVKELVGLWTVEDKSQALKTEHFIKSLTRGEKEKLLANPDGYFGGTPLMEMEIDPKAQENFGLHQIIEGK